MEETLRLTPRESVTVRRRSPEVLEVEARYEAGGKPPPSHLHPKQDERFEVLEGSLETRVDGRRRTLRPGDVLDIPRGAAHQMWNPGEAAARVRWETRPAGRTEQWFRDIDRLHRSGRVGPNGMPGPLAFGVLLTEYRDVFRLALPLEPLGRGGLAILGAVGRRRGYRAGARSL